MWKNLGVNVTGIVGAALENVHKISSDLEAQLDAAVAEDENANFKSITSSVNGIDNDDITESIPSKKSQSSVDLSSVGVKKGNTAVAKNNSESALSSMTSTESSKTSPNKVKTKKSKKKITTGKSDSSNSINDKNVSQENASEEVLQSELQKSKDEERLAQLLLQQEQLLSEEKPDEKSEEDGRTAAELKEAQEERIEEEKRILAEKEEAESKARAEMERKAKEEQEERRIGEEAERIAKEEAEKLKAKEKAEQKKRRDEAKRKKEAEFAERKALEEKRQEELRQERVRDSAEKKKLAEEKHAAEEETRLQTKKAQELARQIALQEAKEEAALKKQADEAEKELKRQQQANDSVSLQHVQEIEMLESRIADFEMKQIELEHRNSELSALLEEAALDSQKNVEHITSNFKAEEEELKASLTESFERSKQAIEAKASVECLALTTTVDECRERIEVLEEEVSSLQEQASIRELDFSQATNKVTQQLQSEIDKLAEVVSDRERALQTSNTQLSDLTRSQEDAETKISSLEQSLRDCRMQIQESSAASSNSSDLKKEILKLKENIQAKDESLAAFQTEGQALAKKQSDMEKNVRKSRQEVREKDTEIIKLKESKEQYVKTIEEMQEVIRANESNSSSTQKHISVMQAVSQASQDKLVKLEADLAAKEDELGVQRKALESSWTEISDLKKIISELKAEKEDLQQQIGLGANKVVATESTRRELEQREAILRATNKQLQDSLQRQMNESVAREDRMREEVNDTRKRWQEAVSSREALASEVSGATTPLLRQISTLQESLRLKSEGWQKIETTLTERAIRAENIADVADKKKIAFEDEIRELRLQLKNDSKKLSELQHELEDVETLFEKTKRLEKEANERISKLQISMNEETSVRLSLENSARDIESRHRKAIQEIRHEKDLELKEKDAQASSLKAEVAVLTHQLKEVNTKADTISINPSPDSPLGMNTSIRQKSASLAAGSESSFAATKINHQQEIQRDEKFDHMRKQIQQVQLSRDALLDEVSYLSSKLSEYEEQLESFPVIQKEIGGLKDQNNTLLIMLGEKEEILEGTIQDMKDMKELYKAEISNLLSGIQHVETSGQKK